MKKIFTLILSLIIVFNIAACPTVFAGGTMKSSRPSYSEIVTAYNSSSLKAQHPRLLATSADFEAIKSLCTTNPEMKEWYKKLICKADEYLKKDTVKYELRDNTRLWYVAQEYIEYELVLGLAYQLTGDDKYAQKAYEHMAAAAEFSDWHPDHEIDVAGMSVGTAIGYDWLYKWMTDNGKDISAIERGFENKAIDLYLGAYANTWNNKDLLDAIEKENNIGTIMNAGAVMSAIAMFDTLNDDAGKLISGALEKVEASLNNFAPDGLWYEGLAYTCLELEFASYLLGSMQKVFGSTYNLDTFGGLSTVVDSFLKLNSSLGSYAWGDTASAGVQYDPSLLWFANHYDNEAAISKYYRMFGFNDDGSKLARTMLWYNPEILDGASEISKDSYFSGAEVIGMHEGWTTSEKAFVGLKGGKPSADHGHMDVGDFAYYANGARWAVDVGGESYGLDDFWSTGDNAGRWRYYGMRAEAHNTLVIEPSESSGGFKSSVSATAELVASKDKGAIATVDMTSSYGNSKVSSAKRGYFFTDDRQSLVVRDEVQFSNSGSWNSVDVYWFMQTPQKAEIIDKDTVELTDTNNPNNKVTLDFISSNSNFVVEIDKTGKSITDTLKNIDGLSDKSAYTRIYLKTTGSKNSSLNITAKLTPNNISGTSVSDYNKSISDWSVESGDITPSISLKSNAQGLALPIGSKVSLDASLSGIDGDEKVKYYRVSGETETLVGEVYADNPELEVEIDTVNTFIAKLYKGDTLLAESNTFVLSDKYLDVKAVHFDVDFENHKLSGETGGNVQDLNGKNITYGSEYLQCNAGSNSAFSIEANTSADTDNGKSLKATVKGGLVQLNEFQTIVNSGYAVYSYDYCIDDYSANRCVANVIYQSGSGAGQINVSMKGQLRDNDTIFGKRIYPNTWVNVKEVVDISGGKIHVFIDDTYLTTLAGRTEGTKKIKATNLDNSTSGNFWIDNFYSAEYASVEVVVPDDTAYGKLLNGVKPVELEKHWDITFDDGATYTDGGWAAIKKNGSDMTTTGNAKLTKHNGTVEFLENTSDKTKSYGKSMKFTSVNSENVGIRDFQAYADSDIIIWSFDYLAEDFGNNRTIGMIKYKTTSGSQPFIGQIGLSMGGQLKSGSGSGGTALGIKLENNKWYNFKWVIDARNKPDATYSVYLDDETLLTTGSMSNFKSLENMKIEDENATGGKANADAVGWFDNLYVAEVKMPEVELVADAQIGAVGSSCKLSADISEISNGYTTAIYLVDEFGKLTQLAKSENSKTATASLTYKNYTQTVRAAALDAEGNVIKYSDDIEIIGNNETISTSIWNLDFDDDATYTMVSWGNLKKDDVEMKPGGAIKDSSSAYYMEGRNGTFTFEKNTTDTSKSYGNSLKAVSTGDTMSFTEFRGYPDSDIIVWSFDYLVEDFGVNRTVGNIRYYTASGTSNKTQVAQIGLSQGGQLKRGSGGSTNTTIGKQIDKNKWYNFKWVIDATNAPNATYTVYLDNEMVLTSGTLSDFYGVERISIADESNSTGCVTWLDNIKVYEMTETEAKVALAGANYKINDTNAASVTAGKLTVSPVVTNDAKAGNYTLIVAVYNADGSLGEIASKPVEFAEGDYGKKLGFEMGDVTSGMKVKTMLWDNLSTTKPMDRAIILE